jgi:hypothetical protein
VPRDAMRGGRIDRLCSSYPFGSPYLELKIRLSSSSMVSTRHHLNNDQVLGPDIITRRWDERLDWRSSRPEPAARSIGRGRWRRPVLTPYSASDPKRRGAALVEPMRCTAGWQPPRGATRTFLGTRAVRDTGSSVCAGSRRRARIPYVAARKSSAPVAGGGDECAASA